MFSDSKLFDSGARVIMDPVHGGIHLHDHEVMAIDHPLFQRLRFICQNDTLNLVFPGANHTRFAHSVGAAHVAGRIFRQISRSHTREGDVMPIDRKLLRGLDYLSRCLRMAVLLHDTGHGPFSHQTENAPVVQKLLKTTGLFERLWADQAEVMHRLYPQIPENLHHEHYSVRAAAKILTESGVVTQDGENTLDLYDVLSLMETTTPSYSERFIAAADAAWPAFAGCTCTLRQPPAEDCARLVGQLLRTLLSGELDADKCDYMLRDTMSCGVAYGHFNLDSLLHALRVDYLPDEGWLGLVLQHKGLAAFEDFLFSRFQLYNHIYNHKTAVGFDLLLQNAVGEYADTAAGSASLERFFTDIDEFRHFTDTYLWEAFRARARVDSNSCAYRLVNRKRIRHLQTARNVEQKEALRKSIALRLGVPVEQIVHVTNLARFSKIRPGFRRMLVEVKDNIDGIRRLHELTEVSDFFGKFDDCSLTHYYLLEHEHE